MTPSPESFRASYVAFSTSIHEASEGRMDRVNGGRQNLMFGGNSAFDSCVASLAVNRTC